MKQGVRGLGVGRKRERRDLKEETGSTITAAQEKALSTNNVGKVVIRKIYHLYVECEEADIFFFSKIYHLYVECEEADKTMAQCLKLSQ